MEGKYRKLTEAEIGQLEGNGCLSPDWTLIEVADKEFDPKFIRRSRLVGHVRLGANYAQPAGVFNALLVDCTVGDNAYISNIGGVIKNYDIGENVRVENCGAIVCDGRGNFGNGVQAKTVNEGGGREVTLFNALTAQFAYMMAMYRENPEFTAALKKIAHGECAKAHTTRGYIASGAHLAGCGKLLNVNVGEAAVVEGASSLRNGTVNSSKESPTYIGPNVKAYDFICAEGSKIDNGAIVERCFVGEGCRVDHYFSAADSLFFANSDVANGEACSIFAGPFTVSHHRSSLLIAGYFSFFNAGSGANQSNHLFKTGALHQGIHERGCKFGSNAYVMLPAREGAFSVVMGRHTSHHDTKDLPYSYLVEEEGKTFVIPGANLRSFGTARDMEKWPRRDKRALKHDIVNFAEYNPYIGEKLLAGIDICETLLAKEGRDVYIYNRVRIKPALLKRGVGSYRMAFDALLGSLLALNATPATNPCRNWVDMAGMFAPADEIKALKNSIVTGKIGDLKAINSELARINKNYESAAKAWAISLLGERLGHKPSAEEIAQAIAKGAAAAETIAAIRLEDSRKDDDKVMQTGYGIDALDAEMAVADFEEVRKIQRQ